MYEFDIHYIERSGLPVKKVSHRMTETELLEWVRTQGVNVEFFDVFRFEREGAGAREGD